MSLNEREIESTPDLAIERALEAASLRAGDSLGGSTASVAQEWEPSAVEAGDIAGGADGD
ncbi:hypothetical protein GE115_00700 [Agromyces sp. CFH 90414]|uniref:Uncharacterized protein n=1 Tax=Agromyces agglutinans TaxID=2662258 RepID=A0A6I2F1C8_9MICO|nr:hypothetical protein [Agromyces agglutinans]MRG58399.1 hypothetical protein [Agromyces agglutinans]